LRYEASRTRSANRSIGSDGVRGLGGGNGDMEKIFVSLLAICVSGRRELWLLCVSGLKATQSEKYRSFPDWDTKEYAFG